MSKILRKCLSLGLAVMLLASLSLHGILTASADNKTGDGLAAHAIQAYNEGWVYSWSGASPGAVDCSGLIYSYVGSGERTTEGMLNASSESGYVSNGVPDIPGLGLWQPGHVGVYVGDGMAVDMRDEISNMCYQSVATKSWVMWFKVAGVSYDTNSSVTNNNQSEEDSNSSYEPEYLSIGSSGSEVWTLQERLKELGYFDVDATGYFGSVTEAALIEFQSDAGLTPDGVYNEDTEKALTSDNAPNKISDTEEATDTEDDTLTDDSEENVNIPTDNGEDSDAEYTASVEKEVSDETDTYQDNDPEVSDDILFTYGDSGDEVSNIQFILEDLGYYHNDINGKYDEKTFNSVEFFQLDNDLPATGSVDEKTLNVLFTEFADKNLQEDNSTDSNRDEVQTSEINVVENEVKFENLYLSSGDNSTDEDTANTDTDSETEEATSAIVESTDTDTENSSTDTDTDTELADSTEATAAATASYDTNTDVNTQTDTETTSSTISDTVKSGGTNTASPSATNTGNTVKSPRTGDPIAMTVQSAIDYVKSYVDFTLVLIVSGISFIVIFFAGTVHYWNVSMEKRRQRARKATTVSVYRRGSN